MKVKIKDLTPTQVNDLCATRIMEWEKIVVSSEKIIPMKNWSPITKIEEAMQLVEKLSTTRKIGRPSLVYWAKEFGVCEGDFEAGLPSTIKTISQLRVIAIAGTLSFSFFAATILTNFLKR